MNRLNCIESELIPTVPLIFLETVRLLYSRQSKGDTREGCKHVLMVLKVDAEPASLVVQEAEALKGL